MLAPTFSPNGRDGLRGLGEKLLRADVQSQRPKDSRRICLQRYSWSWRPVFRSLYVREGTAAGSLRDCRDCVANYDRREFLEGNGELLLDLVIRLGSDSEWRRWLLISLKVAAKIGNEDVFDSVFDACGRSTDFWRSRECFELLRSAALGGSLVILSSILDAGAGPLVRQRHDVNCHLSILETAAREGYWEIVSALLQAGTRMENERMHGGRALTMAVRRHHRDVVVELVAAGANVNAITNRNYEAATANNNTTFTPLSIAASYGEEGVAEILLAAGATLDEDPGNPLPLHAAARDECCGCLDKILTAGASVNWIDHKGCTALHLACRNNQAKAVTILLRHDADIEILNDEGCAAMDMVGIGSLRWGQCTLSAAQTCTKDSICQMLRDASRWGRRGWLVIIRARQLALATHESHASDAGDCGAPGGGVALMTGPSTSREECTVLGPLRVDVLDNNGWRGSVFWMMLCLTKDDVFREIVYFL